MIKQNKSFLDKVVKLVKNLSYESYRQTSSYADERG
jgi:hypothetical protein